MCFVHPQFSMNITRSTLEWNHIVSDIISTSAVVKFEYFSVDEERAPVRAQYLNLFPKFAIKSMLCDYVMRMRAYPLHICMNPSLSIESFTISTRKCSSGVETKSKSLNRSEIASNRICKTILNECVGEIGSFVLSLSSVNAKLELLCKCEWNHFYCRLWSFRNEIQPNANATTSVGRT